MEIYSKTDAVGMKPDTWQQRERAFRSFMAAIAPTMRTAHIERSIAARLRDFEEIDGVKCLRITADSDGQSVKTESSRRLVPIHPDLLKLGLWDRVERLRAEGAERLFPDMRIDSKSGAGNAISKAFSYLTEGSLLRSRF